MRSATIVVEITRRWNIMKQDEIDFTHNANILRRVVEPQRISKSRGTKKNSTK